MLLEVVQNPAGRLRQVVGIEVLVLDRRLDEAAEDGVERSVLGAEVVVDLACSQKTERCIMWCMRRTNIYLQERQTEALDRLAADQGVSRAEIIRRLLDRALGGTDDDLAADLAAIEETFGVAAGFEAPERGLDDRERHLTEVWQRG